MGNQTVNYKLQVPTVILVLIILSISIAYNYLMWAGFYIIAFDPLLALVAAYKFDNRHKEGNENAGNDYLLLMTIFALIGAVSIALGAYMN